MDPENDFVARFCELTAGETQTETAKRLGFTQSYVGQVKRRLHPKPSRELVERIVARYHVDRAEWLRLGGYTDAPAIPETVADVVNQAVLRATQAVNGAQRLAQGLFELSSRFGRPIPVYLQGGAETLTVEEAGRLLADFEQQMLEESEAPPGR